MFSVCVSFYSISIMTVLENIVLFVAVTNSHFYYSVKRFGVRFQSN